MANQKADVVIIGGSHAGSEAAFRLRQGGFAGTIALLGAEPARQRSTPCFCATLPRMRKPT